MTTLALVLLSTALVWMVLLWRRQQRALQRTCQELRRCQREREAALRRSAISESRWHALGEAVLESVLVVGPNLEVSYASPGALELFAANGLPAGRSLVEWTRSADLHELASRALGNTPAGAVETLPDSDRVIQLNDRPFRVRVAASEGGAVLALTDLSELHRLGRARRDLVANISHELRTPLTAIRLLLDGLISRGDQLGVDAVTQLRQIEAEAATLESIAQELLDLEQVESGRAALRLVPTPVEDLVSGAVQAVSAQQQHKGQKLTVDIPPGLVVWADGDQATRALVNVLGNAIKFTPPGGAISISAKVSDGDIVIAVRDTGVGIPPEDLERVFERFYRGDRARSSGSGTGLGLAIARHIVVAHGGRIWAESTGVPGEGSVFYLAFACAEDAA